MKWLVSVKLGAVIDDGTPPPEIAKRICDGLEKFNLSPGTQVGWHGDHSFGTASVIVSTNDQETAAMCATFIMWFTTGECFSMTVERNH